MDSGVWTLLLFMVAGLPLAMAEEEEKASLMDMGVAATLLGIVAFTMVLYYFLNYPDTDIRRYSYEAISSTISIFCAVLTFQAFDSFWERYVTSHIPLLFKAIFDLGQMLFWLVFLQGILAWVSGAVGVSPEKIQDEKKRLRKMRLRERNLKCFGILFAHITGFAAINAFGTMQQLPLFAANPLTSMLAIPVTAGCLWALFSAMNYIRYRISTADDDQIVDEAEALWDEETEDAEDDIAGLTISYLCVQSIRYVLSNTLPDEEGEEPEEILRSHTLLQAILLWLSAVAFTGIMALTVFAKPEEEEGGAEAPKEEEEEGETKGRSYWRAASLTGMMGGAWATFFAARWLLCRTWMAEDEMALAVGTAVLVSLTSFVAIIPLDKIADSDKTGEKADECIHRIIRGIGTLIGFAWERCFDTAVGSLTAGFGPLGGLLKVVMALLVVAIVVPAWHAFILNFIIEQGWKVGFVIEDAVEAFESVPQHQGKPDKEDRKKMCKLQQALQDHIFKLDMSAYQELPGGSKQSEETEALTREVNMWKVKLNQSVDESINQQQALLKQLQAMESKMPLL